MQGAAGAAGPGPSRLANSVPLDHSIDVRPMSGRSGGSPRGGRGGGEEAGDSPVRLWRRPEGLLVGWVLATVLTALIAVGASAGVCTPNAEA